MKVCTYYVESTHRIIVPSGWNHLLWDGKVERRTFDSQGQTFDSQGRTFDSEGESCFAERSEAKHSPEESKVRPRESKVCPRESKVDSKLFYRSEKWFHPLGYIFL